MIPSVQLKRTSRPGHPWIFSNELLESPKNLIPGAVVDVVDHRGKWVGRGFGHPGSLIAVRIARRSTGELDDAWLRSSLEVALARRVRTCSGRTAYRWVHAEADGLPGLIIDRYGDRVVLSANTAAMDLRKDAIIQALREVDPTVTSALWRNDGRGRALEGLEAEVAPAFGEVDGVWTIDDDGFPVSFDPTGGQKTGLFLDMWENRRRMTTALGTGRVADLFSYVGQWGLHAARAGAEEVVCVDRSESALSFAASNAATNGLEISTTQSPVDRFLDETPDRSFDAIVCDPPSFIRSRKGASKGAKAYERLFARTLTKVRRGGYAVVASCSHHLFEDRFHKALAAAAYKARREVVVVVRGGQSPCHPVPATFPEARYLKAVLLEVR